MNFRSLSIANKLASCEQKVLLEIIATVSHRSGTNHGGFQIDFGATLGLRHNNGENFSLGWAALKINYSATKLLIILY